MEAMRTACSWMFRRTSDSQYLTTAQPEEVRSLVISLSRSNRRSNFSFQYPFVPSGRSRRYFRKRPVPPSASTRACQKSPSTNTTTFAVGKTISGLPGTVGEYFLYLRPKAKSAFRRALSARFSVARMADMLRATSSRVFRRGFGKGVGFKGMGRRLAELTTRSWRRTQAVGDPSLISLQTIFGKVVTAT